MKHSTLAPIAAPVTTAPRPRMARRLYRVTEMAPMVRRPETTVRYQIWKQLLPVVLLPSRQPNPSRRLRCVPAVWVPRWLDMANRDRPILTSRQEHLAVGAEDPFYVSVEEAAESLGVEQSWLYRQIADGGFPQPESDGVDMRVSRVVLDEWVYQLIRDAEFRWYRIHSSSLDLREPVAAGGAR